MVSKISYTFYILIFLISLTSCSLFIVPSWVGNTFTQCYGDNSFVKSDKIQHNGFYSLHFNEKSENLLFFRDGIVNRSTSNNFKEEINTVLYSNNRELIQQYYCNNYWGIYKVLNDSIYCEFVIYFGQGMYRYNRSIYKIIDISRIKKIAEMKADETNVSVNKNSFLNTPYPYSFTKLDSLPSSDCWLKKEKWFWCNEHKWREYKKTLK